MWLLEANLALSEGFNSGTEVYHKIEDISEIVFTSVVPRAEVLFLVP
jgi:hypothetical protein